MTSNYANAVKQLCLCHLARMRIRQVWAGLFILAVLLGGGAYCASAQAVEFFDYGFDLIDNSTGGSALDGYISQRFWAESELQWLGAQLRIGLSEGTIFQDTFHGADFTHGPPPAVLIEQQPSLEFDTYVEINGTAPGIVPGGAINIGGTQTGEFSHSGIDITWTPSPGTATPGRFDLGRITLSDDAVGRGAILLSSAGENWVPATHQGDRAFFAHPFEIAGGVIQFTEAPILPVIYRGWSPPLMLVSLTENFEPDDFMRTFFERSIEGTPLGDWILSYTQNSELPFEPLTLQIEEDGGASLDLKYLSHEVITGLTATGQWSVHGDALVFRDTATPEPDTFWLALTILAAAAILWRRRTAAGSANVAA